MIRTFWTPNALAGVALVLLSLGLGACSFGEGAEADATQAQGSTEAEGAAEVEGATESEGPTEASSLPPNLSYAGSVLDLPPRDPEDPPAHETERDWAIARGTLEWAGEQGLSSLPVGEVAAILGSTFVGAPYEPGTLELPGEERLVVNLSVFDCVTLVEHVLTLSRLAVSEVEKLLVAPEEEFRERYREELAALRYREGWADGYVSRLHYFTEWLDRAIQRGVLEEITGELGGIPDERPIHFMTSHPDGYRQLSEDPSLLPSIRDVEERLSEETRLYVPQERIRAVAGGIRNGDVIAAVSTIEGLDIAHTGFALWHEGELHLLHAPLVGESVEISARPLADRILRINGQKGVRVARPVDAAPAAANAPPSGS